VKDDKRTIGKGEAKAADAADAARRRWRGGRLAKATGCMLEWHGAKADADAAPWWIPDLDKEQ
jgi:hypothetical protein